MRKILQLTAAFLFLHVLAYGQTLTASYSISPLTNMCRDTAFKFDASSTNYTGSGTLTYTWYYGDNTSDTGLKTSHFYTKEGVMDVWLKVTSSDGKKDSVKKQLTVKPIPKAYFVFPSKICQNEEIQFTDSSKISSSSWIETWYWVFPDRTSSFQNPLNLFTAAGTYDVKLYITTNDGCKDSITRKVTVYAKPKASWTYTKVCPGYATTFTATSTGTVTSHKWVFHDGTSLTGNTVQKTYSKGGNYNVKLIAYNNITGCNDSITTQKVVVYDAEPNIIIPNKCSDSAVYLVNKTKLQTEGEITNIIVYWDRTNFPSRTERFKAPFASDTLYQGSVNSTVKYNGKLGKYRVDMDVITSTGCTTTVSTYVEIRGKAKAAFTVDSTCLEEFVKFKDGSSVPTGNGGYIKYWTWFFGDSTAGKPNVSYDQNPSYKYKKPGTYKVKLVAATDAGCTDTAYGEVKIFPAPVANFEFTQGCRGLPIQFKDTSYINVGTVNSWYWNFGDPASGSNNTSTSKTPTHSFSDTGTYTVTLVAFSDKGCKDTMRQKVTMYPAPTPGFSFTGNCERAYYYFKDTSKAPAGKSITAWKWIFGDGNSSTDQNPVHQYQAPGDYTVRLSVTTNDGCIESVNKVHKVLESPKAAFFNTPTCFNKSVTFTNNTPNMVDGSTLTYKWYFGDGGTANTRNASHTYTTAGLREVALVVYASNGCKDSLTKLIEITPVPKADFTFTNLCNDSAMRFVDNSTITGSTITQRIWYWGDGKSTSGNDKAPTHNFPAGGKYTVSLVAVSISGCRDSITKTVETYPEPLTKWRYITHCADSAIQFFDETTMPNGDTGYAFKWEFGDGQVSYKRNPTHNYGADNGAIYPVKLTVFSNKGCARELVKNVDVHKLPYSNFEAAGGYEPCAKSNNIFYYSGDMATEKIIDIQWDFGNGMTAYGPDPDPVQYSDSGTYKVTLKAINIYGCVSTTTKDMKVLPLPIPKFGWTGGCQGVPVKFRDSSIAFNSANARALVNMDFGDGSSTKVLHDSHIYNDTGTFKITYILKDTRSKCQDTAVKFIKIYPKPNPGFTSGVVCFGDVTPLSLKSDIPMEDIAAVKWKFSDGSTSNEFNPMHRFTKPGRDTVELTVTTKIGCTNTIKDTVYTFPKPKAEFLANPNPASILNPKVNFTLLTKGYTAYGWSFGDGFGSDDVNPEHLYLDTGKYPVMLWVENANGCRDTLIDTLVVKRDYTLEAPNVLTLNGDNINDKWKPIGEGVENYELIIMDRWGQQVFRTEDFNEYWMGDYNRNGEKVTEGVYVYYIRVIDFEAQEVKVKKGTITVIR